MAGRSAATAEPSATVEIRLGLARVLRIQKLDGLVRLTTGHVVQRAASPALAIIGSVTVPLAQVDALLLAVRKVAKSRVARGRPR